MAVLPIRVLLITPKLEFAIQAKQGLEQRGFEATIATSLDSAFEQLLAVPRHVAVIDFDLPGIALPDTILQIRSSYPDLGILVGPDQPNLAQFVKELNLQGVVSLPCPVRQLVTLVTEAARQMHDSMPDTARFATIGQDFETTRMTPPESLPEGPETLQIEMDDAPPMSESRVLKEEAAPIVEFVLPDAPSLINFEQVEEHERELLDEADKALEIFQKLAAEEPPMPGLEESGTVGDLRLTMNDTNVHEVIQILRSSEAAQGQTPPETEADEASDPGDEGARSIPAAMILEAALDDTTPLGAFSLDELFKAIQQQMPDAKLPLQPLPSWIKESERYVREPDFLPEFAPEDLPMLSATSEYSAATTQASQAENVIDAGQVTTERLEPIAQSHPPRPDSLPDTPPPGPSALPPEPEIHDEDTQKQPAKPARRPTALPEAPPIHDEDTSPLTEEEAAAHQADFQEYAPTPAEQPIVESAPMQQEEDERDAYIAQLAITLTQASLELTAEATLLAKNNRIIAYAGKMPEEDIEEIRSKVSDDWEADPQQARIRFVTLSSTGKDYMLYSRRTEEGFTLSMIFAGTMPLRVIRRLSKRMLDALESVPLISDAEVAPVSIEDVLPEDYAPVVEQDTPIKPIKAVDVGPLNPYSFVWLLRDAERPLGPEVIAAIEQGLLETLPNLYWKINALEVYEDFIYLFAEIPGETYPGELSRSLREESAHFALAADDSLDETTLWAESYLVLTPGRALNLEEIQRFIQFSRGI